MESRSFVPVGSLNVQCVSGSLQWVYHSKTVQPPSIKITSPGRLAVMFACVSKLYFSFIGCIEVSVLFVCVCILRGFVPPPFEREIVFSAECPFTPQDGYSAQNLFKCFRLISSVTAVPAVLLLRIHHVSVRNIYTVQKILIGTDVLTLSLKQHFSNRC